jgi:predicted nucleic acid-binding protein
MKPTVYIETTIPSYYHTTRKSLATEIARTRKWWDVERNAYECFTSQITLDELSEGNYPSKANALELTNDLPLLEVNDEILEIAEVYWKHKLMPRLPVRDALHLAVASFYHMEFVLTWNCLHLANANKMKHLLRLNQLLDLPAPLLVTPAQLQLPEESS